jgi:hypothetical protein
MQRWPLAYFITFHTYGTWLHGQVPGSVDRAHDQFGTPFLLLPADSARHSESRQRMTQEPYLLDESKRLNQATRRHNRERQARRG